MNPLRFGLPNPTVEKICGVLARHSQVEKAILYGSRAKGNYKTHFLFKKRHILLVTRH